jgi:hypothetical protein
VNLADKPAWPMCPVVLSAPVKFDALHCSEDNRVRVATVGGKFFVSVDGDNFAGPFRSAEAAQVYGESATKGPGA